MGILLSSRALFRNASDTDNEMIRPIRILLQTTVPYNDDDWHVGRFSLLAGHIRSLKDHAGNTLCNVVTRDREADENGNDKVLNRLDELQFDQLWLFALDMGDGLTSADCSAITRFRERGGAILSARDHDDMGSSLCTLGGIGAAHYFHSKNPDPDAARNSRDDQDSPEIDYPNYHSGWNGDYQKIAATDHELFSRDDGSLIEYFPAHVHEGGIGAPDNSSRVVAKGTSQTTGRDFNLVVAFDHSTDANGNRLGRAIAESSFHHFVDYNWDLALGGPTFLSTIDTPGDGIRREPEKLNDVKRYVENAVKWLGRV
jgi:hypothetical protein